MRVYQFRHVGIVLLASTADCFTADDNENNALLVVPTKGLEPLHPKAHGPEPCASTNSATWALCCLLQLLTALLRITTKTTRCWWCPRMDPNHARLPIPPRGHCYCLLLVAACSAARTKS